MSPRDDLCRCRSSVKRRRTLSGEAAEEVGIGLVDQAVAGAAKLRNSPNWLRSLVGYARVFYRPLGLTESELKGGAKRVGLWDR